MDQVNVKCPSCGTRFIDEPQRLCFYSDLPVRAKNIEVIRCLQCGVHIIQLVHYEGYGEPQGPHIHRQTLSPADEGKAEVPDEVPDDIASAFREAVLVLRVSANGSACLSRRCLQSMLRANNPGMKKGRLVDEIKYVIARKDSQLPTALKRQLDHVREIGNFGAHEERDADSYDVIDVDEGEADYLIGILRSLMDHYYVLPMEAERRGKLIGEKKQRAGKRQRRRSPV